MLEHEYVFLSNEQLIVAHVFTFLSCTLSFLGSGNIIYLVMTRKGSFTNPSMIYHRLVFGLSVMDLFTTLSLFLNPWLVRKDLGFIMGMGNVRTCELLGVLLQACLGSVFYNTVLSLFFLLSIRYQRKPKQLSKLMEPWVHIVAVALPIIYGVVGILLGTFNSSLVIGGVCETSRYPWNCEMGGKNDEEDVVECERGSHEAKVRYSQVGLIVILSAVGLVSTWLVYWTIRKQTVRVRRWSTEADATSGEDVRRRDERTTAVGWQAIYYSLAFLGIASAMSLVTLANIFLTPKESTEELVGNKWAYAIIFILWAIFPLQGFFNCIIYVRPRLLRWKRVEPEKSWLWAYRQVLSQKAPPPQQRSVVRANKQQQQEEEEPGTDPLSTEVLVRESPA